MQEHAAVYHQLVFSILAANLLDKIQPTAGKPLSKKEFGPWVYPLPKGQTWVLLLGRAPGELRKSLSFLPR